jgi:UDPglucose 6-dehydrogenase
MNIGIIGSGHVGLVSGTCFAEIGNTVACMDDDPEKIENLKQGIMPFYEPGLEEMVKKNIKEGRLSLTLDLKKTVEESLILFIAVGTPSKGKGEADLSAVERVTSEIAQTMKEYRLIVEKSTVPVETGIWMKKTMARNIASGIPFDLASNPEFLREGNAIYDFMNPDRIVLGFETEKAGKILRELYEPFQSPIVETDIETAEMIKHASNSFLATKISFINSLSILCEKVGADVVKVAEGMGLDKRIRPDFLRAGIGFGGLCFPKDIRAFSWIAEKLGYDFRLLKEVDRINEEQKRRFVEKVKEALWNLEGKSIGVLGLSFKPDTDDIRYSPAVHVVELLLNEGAGVRAYDPAVPKEAHPSFEKITFCSDPYEAARDVDGLVLLTEWEEFNRLDYEKLKKLMKTPVLIDGRNQLDPENMKALGFLYQGIGR